MTKEDWDSIIELGKFYGQRDASIPSKVCVQILYSHKEGMYVYQSIASKLAVN